MGEWERLGPSWWAYRRATQERPYGYALRQGRGGSESEESESQEAVWVAIVLGWERGTDETFVERGSLVEARAAVEQHAVDHAGRG